jgi:triosephosphate isomerase
MPPVRPVIVAGNWKMHTTPHDAAALARSIARLIDEPSVTRVICPPFVSLAPVGAELAGSGIEIGAQNVHHEASGAFTGEVSAPMLVGLATWVICGHSERRRDACESDAVIGRKVARALEYDLRPILAVGETLAQREAGSAADVVRGQLRGAFAAFAELASTSSPDQTKRLREWLVVAYEPVWAIGTGRNARGPDAAAMADVIRETLAELGWPGDATGTPVLYGGSCTVANIGEFLTEPAIDGALVGGASLKADEMAGIVARAALTARARQELTTTAGRRG